jgi:hypothetical protein
VVVALHDPLLRRLPHELHLAHPLDKNGQLWDKYYDGSNWFWEPQGVPPGNASVGSRPAAVYQPTQGRLTVFVVGKTDGRLWDKYYNGSSWFWEPQGVPGAAGGVSAPAAYRHPTLDRTFVFVAGTDGKLYDKYYDGSIWVWEQQDTPRTNVTGTGAWGPAVAYLATLHRLVVFVVGADAQLYDKYTDDGSTWVWESQGSP